MLRKLILHHVGPADHLELTLAPRVNLLTGDNGLGKSFLLEIAWWSLTRAWHEVPAVPSAPEAEIAFQFDGDKSVHKSTAKWNKEAQQWRRKRGRPPNPGLVLYARVDGSFSVWDPARNYRLYTRADGSEAESPAAYQFGPAAVMEGLRRTVNEAGIDREQVLCAGLIDDWTRWQDTDDARFALLKRLLEHLGPDEQPLLPGEPIRPSLDDQRRIPTIQMPYGKEIPLTYAPAGVKRMAKLAYLLAWSLSEHETESERTGLETTRQVIVLFDEPETHLHPRWQRTVLPSITKAVAEWQETHPPEVQLIVATHSPLLLASMEPTFDPARDALWKLDLVDGEVQIERDEWHPRGDANRWLVSDVFDLGAATSREVEAVREEAVRLINASDPPPADVAQVDERLARLLPEMDPFFVRWRHYMSPHLPAVPTQ